MLPANEFFRAVVSRELVEQIGGNGVKVSGKAFLTFAAIRFKFVY